MDSNYFCIENMNIPNKRYVSGKALSCSEPINAHSSQKQSDDFDETLWAKVKLEELYSGNVFRTLPTTLIQIFCKIVNSKCIIKSTIDPDKNY